MTGQIYEIKEGSQVLARYTRRGIKSTVKIEYVEPGIEMTYIASSGTGAAGDQYTGLDRFNRIVDIRWKTSSADLERVKYGFDRAGNRTWRENTVAISGFDELYTYDGLYQISQLKRGDLNGSYNGITSATWQEDFTYDPTGNWLTYGTSGSSNLSQTREHNKANEITDVDPAGTVGYDAAGNMSVMPKVGNWSVFQQNTWDAWNRLVKVIDGMTTVAQYRYDGYGWITTAQTPEDGTLSIRHLFYSQKWQVVEERVNSSTNADRQWVWGARYLDDLILRDRELPLSSTSSSSSSAIPSGTERLYALHDQWHVTCIISASGSLLERYSYDAFGTSKVLNSSFATRAMSLYAWEIRFGAYRLSLETGLHTARYRRLHSSLGRWLSNDPLHRIGANRLGFVRNNPTNATDVFGLCTKGKVCCPECESYVGNANTTPKRDQAADGMVDLARETEKMDQIMDGVENTMGAIRGGTRLIENLAGNAMDDARPDAGDMAKKMKEKANEGVGNFSGWGLHTRIKFKKCECVGLWQTLFGNPSWHEHQSAWVRYNKGGEDDRGTFDDKKDAQRAARMACADQCDEWRQANSGNIEE